jgi:predicted DNA-binding protein
MKKQEATTRTSVTLPLSVYETLETIARQKRVSLAWVMRDAAERYVSDRWPLLNVKDIGE